MNIKKTIDFFIGKIFVKVKTSELKETVAYHREYLKEVVTPANIQILDFAMDKKFTSKELNDLITRFVRYHNPRVNKSQIAVLKTISDDLNNLNNVFDTLNDGIRSEFPEEETYSRGLSIRQTMLLKIIDHMDFMLIYTMVFYDYILNEEINNNLNIDKVKNNKAVIKYIENNFASYTMLLGEYVRIGKSLDTILEKTPDVIISDKIKGITQVLNSDAKKLLGNPELTSGFIGSPILVVGKMFAEFQVERYESLKDRRKLLELKLTKVKMAREQEGQSPELDKRIQYYQNKVDKITYKLTKAEKSVE